MAYATVEELAAVLHVRVSPETTAELQFCLDAAAAEIDDAVDRVDPIPQDDPIAHRVNLGRAVEWWKMPDAPFGWLGFDDLGAYRLPRSGFARWSSTLTPLKQLWPVA